jgi:hypothetical protein
MGISFAAVLNTLSLGLAPWIFVIGDIAGGGAAEEANTIKTD